ncbi:MAG: DUF4258 domain-containing protein [Chloroflexota bacterium]|nr:DUF4258 domain-containing protein [Chloroflexota bacterium]
MASDSESRDIFFEVETPLGFRVQVTQSYWDMITSVKHPIMAGRESAIQESLQNPEEIRQSKRDSAVYLFYRSEDVSRWVCAVAKRIDGEGFLITAYRTDTVKEGKRIWPK